MPFLGEIYEIVDQDFGGHGAFNAHILKFQLPISMHGNKGKQDEPIVLLRWQIRVGDRLPTHLLGPASSILGALSLE